jgi:hypothetical protein
MLSEPGGLQQARAAGEPAKAHKGTRCRLAAEWVAKRSQMGLSAHHSGQAMHGNSRYMLFCKATSKPQLLAQLPFQVPASSKASGGTGMSFYTLPVKEQGLVALSRNE